MFKSLVSRPSIVTIPCHSHLGQGVLCQRRVRARLFVPEGFPAYQASTAQLGIGSGFFFFASRLRVDAVPLYMMHRPPKGIVLGSTATAYLKRDML